MDQKNNVIKIPQYSLTKILLVWAAASIPMAVLGWVVAPTLSHGSTNSGIIRLAVLTAGLIWQFVLSIILLYNETGNLRWSTLKDRLWLNQPYSNKTGKTSRVLWWWLIPLILLTALYEMQISGMLDNLWVTLFPFFTEPTNFSLNGYLGSPEGQAKMVGAWGFFWLFIISAIFNTILGEELLFRGLLLPRMADAFGKWDWIANGILFGLYHLHQPWMIFSAILEGIFFFAFSTKYTQSVWFGIIAHSGQSLFFAFLLLGLVLGLA